jgi:hypothetical protein
MPGLLTDRIQEGQKRKGLLHLWSGLLAGLYPYAMPAATAGLLSSMYPYEDR